MGSNGEIAAPSRPRRLLLGVSLRLQAVLLIDCRVQLPFSSPSHSGADARPVHRGVPRKERLSLVAVSAARKQAVRDAEHGEIGVMPVLADVEILNRAHAQRSGELLHCPRDQRNVSDVLREK